LQPALLSTAITWLRKLTGSSAFNWTAKNRPPHNAIVRRLIGVRGISGTPQVGSKGKGRQFLILLRKAAE
jgi:hypothetical protein